MSLPGLRTFVFVFTLTVYIFMVILSDYEGQNEVGKLVIACRWSAVYSTEP